LLIILITSIYVWGYESLIDCKSECGAGKTCIFQDGIYKCKDYCVENNLPKALSGECSVDLRYCNPSTKQLESNRCDICGCPANHECLDDGSCKKICSDGTEIGGCSPIHSAKQCTPSLQIEEDCLACGGCLLGKSCSEDGICDYEVSWIQTTYEDFAQGIFNSVSLSAEPENIAPLGKAFASSNYEIPEWTIPPSINYLNDGSYSGEWLSDSSKDQYIGIEWNYPVEFNKVSFYQTFFRIRNFKVQYLKEGVWADITSLIKPLYSPDDFTLQNKGNYNYEDEIVFEKVKSNAVRVFMPECVNHCRIHELRVFNTEPSYITVKPPLGDFISHVYDTQTLKDTIEYKNIYFDIGGIIK
jgi:hypothetical protein